MNSTILYSLSIVASHEHATQDSWVIMSGAGKNHEWLHEWTNPCSRFMSSSWVAHRTANKSGFMRDFISGFMSGSWLPQSRPLMIKRISMSIPLGFQLGSWLSISYILQNSWWSFEHALWWMLPTFLYKSIVLNFVLSGFQTISKSDSFVCLANSDHMIYVHGCFMSGSWATHG